MDSIELQGLVQAVASVILDDETLPTWSIDSSVYYAKLAEHVCDTDPDLVADIKRVTARFRKTYRSHLEHSHMVSLVEVTKSQECTHDDVCCVCLQACDTTWQRMIRLRSHDGDPAKCGHRLHKTCALRMHPGQDGHVKCPLCRESLGPYARFWVDDESDIPRF